MNQFVKLELFNLWCKYCNNNPLQKKPIAQSIAKIGVQKSLFVILVSGCYKRSSISNVLNLSTSSSRVLWKQLITIGMTYGRCFPFMSWHNKQYLLSNWFCFHVVVWPFLFITCYVTVNVSQNLEVTSFCNRYL